MVVVVVTRVECVDCVPRVVAVVVVWLETVGGPMVTLLLMLLLEVVIMEELFGNMVFFKVCLLTGSEEIVAGTVVMFVGITSAVVVMLVACQRS